MRSWVLACVLQLSCCACGAAGASDGGQTGGEDPTCLPGPYTPVERDQATTTSYAPAQILDTLGTTRSARLEYEDGSQAELSFTFDFIGPAQSSAECDWMQLPLSVDAASLDGAWSARDRQLVLLATSADKATLTLVGDASSFGVDLARYDVGQHASYDLSLHVFFGKYDAFGSVAIVGHDPERIDTTYLLGTVEAP